MLEPRFRFLCARLAAATLLLAAAHSGVAQDESPAPPTDFGQASPLPLPNSLSLFDYEQKLFDFLNRQQYRELGWLVDKRVRDTGPYIDGKYYGTHPAVRIYYSPEIIQWLLEDKRGPIPDGAMIIKEQYEPPAARYDAVDEERLIDQLQSWTVMVKDAAGSHDGWFWSNPAKDQQAVVNHQYPFDHPVSGFGIYCVRCHSSVKTTGATNEYTFAALRNIKGFPGEPVAFRVDDSWRRQSNTETPRKGAPLEDTTNEALVEKIAETEPADGVHPRCTGAAHPELCMPKLNREFLKQFSSIPVQDREKIQHIPPVTHDWVVRRPAGDQKSQPFVTSNQCMSCHAGLLAPFGPAMFISTGDEDEDGEPEYNAEYGAPGVHVSPYGEWRWTPMGLAGRDPVFFAQLESEIALIKRDYADDSEQAEELSGQLMGTCLTCHGAMGKHQFHIDHGEGAGPFQVDHLMRASTDPAAAGQEDWRYGALARDGISCTVCHHMQPRPQPADDKREYLEYYLETSTTGNIHLGDANELHGQFEDKEIAPYAMEHALGYTAKHNPYIKSSQLCGSCHVVNLPAIDKPHAHDAAPDQLIAAEQNETWKDFHHHVEQATYLEWLNSEFENELHPDNPKAKSCQDCHMSRDLRHDGLKLALERIETRMAAIQDNTYPEAENLAERKDLEVRLRTEGYARHNFRGLNMFLLEMFNQFDDILGVRKFDFMTGSTNDIPHAVDDFMRLAKNETAEVGVKATVEDRELTAVVDIRNKVGHRFPSGVGFRRAFLELLVVERPSDTNGQERILWSSGRTNELGVLVDEDGEPLATEFFAADKETKAQAWQPHHEVITSSDQVQIYETLLRDAAGRFTTSFIRGSEVVKDNRLLPRGWKKEGPGPALNGQFLEATWPDAATLLDPRYADGSGADQVTYRVKLPEGVDAARLQVRATLYYQAMPPYFLRNLFETAPDGPATRRLHYMAANIDLANTPIKDWKLPVVSATAAVE